LNQSASSQLLTPTELVAAVKKSLEPMAQKKGVKLHVEWVDGVYDWKTWLDKAGTTVVNKDKENEYRQM
jgi:hypothetical protein